MPRTDSPYDPNAGYHPAPDQSYGAPDPNGRPYQDRRSSPPQHHSYDPQSGLPIPPGHVPSNQAPPSSYDPNRFPPPPREEYRDYDDRAPPGPRSEYDREYSRAEPSEYGARPNDYNDRPYAPTDPRPNEGNQIAPYNEEVAEAEWRRGYEEQQRYQQWEQQQRQQRRPPLPPSDYSYDSRYMDRGYDERDPRSDDRRHDRGPPMDDRDSMTFYDYDEYDRRDDRRKRDSRRPDRPAKSTGKDILGGQEGERGFGAQLLGGAAGGLLGHELGGGLLETLGGVVAGAIGAKVLENQHEKRQARKQTEAANQPQGYGRTPYERPTDGRSRVRDPTREDRRNRQRSRSVGGGRRDDYDDGYYSE